MKLKLNVLMVIFIAFWLCWSNQIFSTSENSSTLKFIIFFLVPTILLIIGFSAKHLSDKIAKTKAAESTILFSTSSFSILTLSGTKMIIANKLLIDIQFNDTYFIIANYQVLIIVALIFGVFAIVYGILARIFEIKLKPLLNEVHFWTTTLGVLVLAGPLHNISLNNVPRRYYSFEKFDAFSHFDNINKVITIIAIIIIAAQLVFLFNLIYGLINRFKNSANKNEIIG